MSLTNEYFSYFPYAIKGSGGDYESVLVVANSKAYDGDGGYCEQALSKKHYDDDAVCGTAKNTGDCAAMWTATTTAASQPPLLLHFDRGLLLSSGPYTPALHASMFIDRFDLINSLIDCILFEYAGPTGQCTVKELADCFDFIRAMYENNQGAFDTPSDIYIQKRGLDTPDGMKFYIDGCSEQGSNSIYPHDIAVELE
ncbi:hypothetical protein BGZ88_003100 [Linnemannia elongata]|nr:hypothetical protein BGZ88_003100 [Linnemannia elongata]